MEIIHACAIKFDIDFHDNLHNFCRSTGSSSSDVLTSKDISASQSDITSIIHQTNQSNSGSFFFIISCIKSMFIHIMLTSLFFFFPLIYLSFVVTITNGSNKSSGSSHRENLACSSNGGNHDQEISGKYFLN